MEKFSTNLAWKSGEEVKLDLLDDGRQLIHTGKLLLRSERAFGLGGWSELVVFLFDNYFVMTEVKVKNGVAAYHVHDKPIPVEFLELVNFNEPPLKRGSSPVFPYRLRHSGLEGAERLLFTGSEEERSQWKAKLEESINIRSEELAETKVFEVTKISQNTFVSSYPFSIDGSQTSAHSFTTNKITCTVPIRAADGHDLLIVGCDTGVWIGPKNNSYSLQRVLILERVTQCAVLKDLGLLLVLADKTLCAYKLEELLAIGPVSPTPVIESQQLSTGHEVEFFAVGSIGDRTFLTYMRKDRKKKSDSFFCVLEPVSDAIVTAKLSDEEGAEWFKVSKQFFLPSPAHDLIFLKSKIAVLCANGVEVMDFWDVTIPLISVPSHAGLAKRLKSRHALGMFRSSENEFLLCYDEFGLYVDSHGDPTSRQAGVIEWEGTAGSIAFHSPYIVVFSSRFIEVRDVVDGRLVQVIQGTEIQSTYDGRSNLHESINGLGPTRGGPKPDKTHTTSASRETRVHFVMKGHNGPYHPTPTHHLFELTPIDGVTKQ
ncbi:CNH-domain-containing protein [Clavulina sp. PMI_390]|nr:CNH-domain-containing protein [Clavulina sp. PMI_390]